MEMQKINVGLAVIARKFFDVAYLEQMIPAMRGALESESSTLHYAGLVFTPEEAKGAARLFAERGCDLVVLAFGTFADASPAVALAQATEAPLLLWSPAEPTSETGRLRLNSFCGANLAGNALVGVDRPFRFVYGSPDDPRAVRELQLRVRVAAVAKTLRQARIGLFGVRPDGYYACNFDEMELRGVVGAQVEYISIPQLRARAEQASPGAKADFVSRLKARTVGMEKLDPKQVDDTAGVYAAVRSLVEEKELSGVAVRCWPEFFVDYGHAVCGAVGQLTDDGIMAGCEADVNGAVTMMAQHLLTGEPTFIADVVAIDEEQNGWTLWHCGGQPVSLASPKWPVEAAYQPNRRLALSVWFGARPGPVTVARLSYQRGRYRMLVMKGEVLDRPPSYSMGASALVRLEGDALAAAKGLVEKGFEHHVVMSYGDVSAEMIALAETWGIEVVRL
jgi:L-fucose isomerase-like protein